MSKKKWIICGECKFYAKCKAGQNKTQNIDITSKVYNEVGCFEHEQYYASVDGRQLRIF